MTFCKVFRFGPSLALIPSLASQNPPQMMTQLAKGIKLYFYPLYLYYTGSLEFQRLI